MSYLLQKRNKEYSFIQKKVHIKVSKTILVKCHALVIHKSRIQEY